MKSLPLPLPDCLPLAGSASCSAAPAALDPHAASAASLQPGRAGCGHTASRPARAAGTYRAGAAVAELVEAKLQV